jgi:1-deoxy-D-xylulose-5-phosphate synthase
VLLDVALHRLPVTMVLDRAGITGPDGPSHHGVWDLATLGLVPGLRIAAPRGPAALREQLREAVNDQSGPTVLRFPKAPAGPDLPAQRRVGGVDVLHADVRPRTLIVAVGAMAPSAVDAARQLAAAGHGCTVVDPRWVRPVAPVLAGLAARHRLVCTVEDGVRAGGIGSAVARYLADEGVSVPVRVLGLPDRFVPHGSRAQLLARYGLDASAIAASVADSLPGLDHAAASGAAAERVLAGTERRRQPECRR